jgi:hypothetical protein
LIPILTRRSILLGVAASSLFANDALACHLYVSPVDGRVGCGARHRDLKNGVSGDSGSTSTGSTTTSSGTTSTVSEPQSPPSTDTSTSGLVYRDELCGFNQSRKSGQRSRLAVSSAPDGKRAIEAVYLKGQSACGATTFLDLFSGNGVGRAVFEVDLWISQGFEDIPGKLCGAYGGGDAWGGQVARKLGCRVAGGWASRLTHGRLDRVYLYSYHQNRDTTCRSNGRQFGKNFVSKQKLTIGRWVTFRHEIVMNTPGNSNGIVRLWMDGSKLLDIGGLMYQQESDRYGIKGWSIWSALGGSCNSSSFFPKSDIRVWYRDLRVYT